MKIQPVVIAVCTVLGLAASSATAQQRPRTSDEDYREAVAAAHDPDANGALGTHGDAHVESAMDPEIPRQEALKASLPGGPAPESRALVFTSTADPAVVAADAVAAARAPDQNVAAESKVNSRLVPTMPVISTTAAK